VKTPVRIRLGTPSLNKTGIGSTDVIGIRPQPTFQAVLPARQPHLGIVHFDPVHEQPQIALARREIAAEKLFADGGTEGRNPIRSDDTVCGRRWRVAASFIRIRPARCSRSAAFGISAGRLHEN
jgi:hypothetical protein